MERRRLSHSVCESKEETEILQRYWTLVFSTGRLCFVLDHVNCLHIAPYIEIFTFIRMLHKMS